MSAVGSVTGSVASSVDWAAGKLGTLDPRFLAAALAFQLGILVCRAVAWRNVLRAAYPSHRVSLLGVGAAYAVGVGLNGLVPARGGEAAKVALVRLQLPQTSVATIAASSSVILLLDAVIGAALLTTAAATGTLASLPAPPGAAWAAGAAGGHTLWATTAALSAAALAFLAGRRLAPRLAALWSQARRGFSVLRTPGRYLRQVAVPQLGAWLCRVGVVLALLAAFGLPATIPVAMLVIVLGGVSTMVPGAPGGLGAQQLLLVYALRETVSAAAVVSFSLGMQATVTVLNVVVGVAAAMLVFRTVRPAAAVRASLRASRRGSR
jgi:uncharacterized membrane protein YbhN (UPF0104 family)